MCGIAGFTHKNWSPDVHRIEEAVATLIHRGPDQQGVFRSNVCSMGAARLKIIDLETGDQPMISDDGGKAIVFNGEIYNHAELRAELETLGHCFHSRTDTETVLRAFIEWGIDCFCACAACLPWACGTNRNGCSFWRATAWVSSRSISPGGGPRHLFRLRTEDDSDSSRVRAQSRSGCAGLLAVAQLCSGPVDTD